MATDEKPGRFLLIGSPRLAAQDLRQILAVGAHTVDEALDVAASRAYLEKRSPEVILLDLDLGEEEGLELLSELRTLEKMASIVVHQAQPRISTVVEATKRGADHFLSGQLEEEDLRSILLRALEQHRIRRRVLVYQDVIASRTREGTAAIPELVGSSPAMERVRELAYQVAGTEASVVLLGETGTGKGVLARAIHRLSRRAAAPFVDINCATLPRELVESEIFGHEKGAFTGALEQKPGLMEVAHQGTVFFDEVGELQLPAQSKLVKAIEDRVFRRVGGVKEISVDIRILAATNRRLDEQVKEGSFREDLFYRLNVFQILLPPLRDRGDDILELADDFVGKLNFSFGRQVETISEAARQLLTSYSWPGNVRELRNVIERAIILAEGSEIRAAHLPKNLTGELPAAEDDLAPLAEVELEHIRRVTAATRFNMSRAAEILGISRSTLYAKMEQAGLDVSEKRRKARSGD
jgi:DNA-binding NtrC family response regulator